MTTYTIRVHDDGDAGFWADVAELPGAFAAAHTLGELHSGIAEAIVMCTEDDAPVQLELGDLAEPTEGGVAESVGHLTRT